MLRRVTTPLEDRALLSLDASRAEALEYATAIVSEAWRSFDAFRPDAPQVQNRTATPEEPEVVFSEDLPRPGPASRGPPATDSR